MTLNQSQSNPNDQTLELSQQYLTNLIDYLHTLDPYISTAEGDPIRLILETVSQQLAQSNLTMQANDNFLNLSVLAGSDLDSFGSWFGFKRWAGTPSTVSLNFYTLEAVNQNIQIPQGTQVNDGNNHTFQTTSTGQINQGSQSVLIPAQSINTGSSQNVQPYTLVNLTDNLSNTNLCVLNPNPATGGTDEETDTHFRNRIQSNLFRRVIGSSESYQSLANQIGNTTRSKCISAISTFSELNEIVPLKTGLGGGSGFSSTITDAKYIYPNSSYLIKNADETGQINYVEGAQYIFNTSLLSNVPVFQINNQGLSLTLSSLEGTALNQFGNSLNIPRKGATFCTGYGQVGNFNPQSTDLLIPQGTQFLLQTSENLYTVVTQQNTVIPSNSTQSPSVPFTFEMAGEIDGLSDGMELNAGNNANQNTYLTINSFTNGSEGWTDRQYRSEIENSYASEMSLNDGQLVYSQFSYCSQVSRNNPPSVTNCLDLFIDGQNLVTQTEASTVSLTQITSENQQNWLTYNGNYPPLNSYIQILYTPCISSLSGYFTANGTEYTDTSLLKPNSNLLNSDKAQVAILFSDTTPTNGQAYNVPLIVNSTISNTQSNINNVRTLGADILVHEGIQAKITVNVVLIPQLGTPSSTLQNIIQTNLSSYFSNLNFGSDVILSDVLMNIAGSKYVKAVRIAQANDVNAPTIDNGSLNYGLQVEMNYSLNQGGTYTNNFKLPDNAYPVLNGLNISLEANNTYVNSYNQAGSVNGNTNGLSTQANGGNWFYNPDFYIA